MSENKITFSIIVAHRESEPPLLNRESADRLCWEGVEIIHVSGNRPSKQRNAAARRASGEILYFLDNDALPQKENLDRIAEVFSQNPEVAVCGGPSLTPAEDSLRQKGFGHVLGSFWGSAWMSARYAAHGSPRICTDRELILCNLAFRRDVFLQMEGFNESLYPNEENDLMDRIVDQGGVLYYHPEIAVQRSQRTGFRSFFRQLFGYGRGRSEQLRVDFRPGKIPLFVFAGLPVYLLALPVLLCVSPWFLLPLIVHFVIDILFSFSSFLRNPFAFFVAVPSFFFCHLFYGLGMWRGFFGKFRSSTLAPAEVTVRVNPGKGAHSDV